MTVHFSPQVLVRTDIFDMSLIHTDTPLEPSSLESQEAQLD